MKSISDFSSTYCAINKETSLWQNSTGWSRSQPCLISLWTVYNYQNNRSFKFMPYRLSSNVKEWGGVWVNLKLRSCYQIIKKMVMQKKKYLTHFIGWIKKHVIIQLHTNFIFIPLGFSLGDEGYKSYVSSVDLVIKQCNWKQTTTSSLKVLDNTYRRLHTITFNYWVHYELALMM